MSDEHKCSKRGCSNKIDNLFQFSGYSFPDEEKERLQKEWFCAKHFNELLTSIEKKYKMDLSQHKEEE